MGEMERDALLAHGTSYCLKDRLFDCSDKSKGHICTNCGNLLSCFEKKIKGIYFEEKEKTCLICKENANVKEIEIPYVLRYMVNEIAGMNINLSFVIKETDKLEYL